MVHCWSVLRGSTFFIIQVETQLVALFCSGLEGTCTGSQLWCPCTLTFISGLDVTSVKV